MEPSIGRVGTPSLQPLQPLASCSSSSPSLVWFPRGFCGLLPSKVGIFEHAARSLLSQILAELLPSLFVQFW